VFKESNWSYRSGLYDLAPFTNHILASCSMDSTIKIWNTTRGVNLRTLQGHRATVICIRKISVDVLISSSMDKTIRLWNLTSGDNFKIINEGVDVVDCYLLLENGRLASGDRDFMIKI
jgi:WD40 repeat protein